MIVRMIVWEGEKMGESEQRWSVTRKV